MNKLLFCKNDWVNLYLKHEPQKLLEKRDEIISKNNNYFFPSDGKNLACFIRQMTFWPSEFIRSCLQRWWCLITSGQLDRQVKHLNYISTNGVTFCRTVPLHRTYSIRRQIVHAISR